MKRWSYSLILLAMYLAVFHAWMGLSRTGIQLSGILVSIVAILLFWRFLSRGYFCDGWDQFTHGAVILDMVLEATLIPQHDHYGFYWCAIGFASVIVCYRSFCGSKFGNVHGESPRPEKLQRAKSVWAIALGVFAVSLIFQIELLISSWTESIALLSSNQLLIPPAVLTVVVGSWVYIRLNLEVSRFFFASFVAILLIPIFAAYTLVSHFALTVGLNPMKTPMYFFTALAGALLLVQWREIRAYKSKNEPLATVSVSSDSGSYITKFQSVTIATTGWLFGLVLVVTLLHLYLLAKPRGNLFLPFYAFKWISPAWLITLGTLSSFSFLVFWRSRTLMPKHWLMTFRIALDVAIGIILLSVVLRIGVPLAYEAQERRWQEMSESAIKRR